MNWRNPKTANYLMRWSLVWGTARSLGIVISTQSADDDHPLSLLIDGLTGIDPSVHVQLHAAPEDLIRSTRRCGKRNPVLGSFLDRAEFAAQAERAARALSFMSSFRNLRLNQRVHAEGHLIQRDDWLACAGEVDPDSCADGGRAVWICRRPQT